MKEQPRFKIVKAYGFYRVGDIIQPTGMMRDSLINGRFIVPVREEATTADAAQPEQAVATGARLSARRRQAVRT